MGLGWPSMGHQRKVSIKAMRAWASRCLTGGLSRADSRLPLLAHRSVLPLLPPCTPGSQPARPGCVGTGSSLLSLALPPEMLPITGIISIWGLSRPRAALEADGSAAVGAGWVGWAGSC